MAENTSTFTGAAADGTALTAVYLTQPAANVAIGLVFAGSPFAGADFTCSGGLLPFQGAPHPVKHQYKRL